VCQKSVALSLAKYLAPAANLNRNGKDLNSPDLHFCLSRETKEICRRPYTLNPKQIIRESWTSAIWSATWDIILFTDCKHLPFFLLLLLPPSSEAICQYTKNESCSVFKSESHTIDYKKLEDIWFSKLIHL
jgi:hypothetical protein